MSEVDYFRWSASCCPDASPLLSGKTFTITREEDETMIHGVLVGVIAGLLLAGPVGALEVGQKAPDFKLAASTG